MKTDIGIIAAMQIEIDGIISLLTETETENVSGMDFVSGILRGKRVVAVKCGVRRCMHTDNDTQILPRLYHKHRGSRRIVKGFVMP